MNDKKEQVNFGFTPVSKAEKTERVQDVFSDVASYYDIMNDVMSFGLHRLWKDSAINILNPKPDQKILDLAAGTGDLGPACCRFLSPRTKHRSHHGRSQ